MGQQGNDVIYGEDGDDLLIGGSNVAGALDGDDVIDGGAGHDAIAGDNADCCIRPDTLDPRMRSLNGTLIYGTSIPNGTDGHALVTVDPGNLYDPAMRHDPTGIRQYRVVLLDHSDVIALIPDLPNLRLWGDDYLAGGAGGRDLGSARKRRHPGRRPGRLLPGHGWGRQYFVFERSVRGTTGLGERPVLLPDGVAGTRIGAWRTPNDAVEDTLHVNPSIERATDGDDYIEGNGGLDTIFGGLGQDDIVGDSSDLYLSRAGRPARHDHGPTITFPPAVTPEPWRIAAVSADGRTLTVVGARSPPGRSA